MGGSVRFVTPAGFAMFPPRRSIPAECWVCADGQFTEFSRDGSGYDGGAGPLGSGPVWFE